jgi:hypothetical protein
MDRIPELMEIVGQLISNKYLITDCGHGKMEKEPFLVLF